MSKIPTTLLVFFVVAVALFIGLAATKPVMVEKLPNGCEVWRVWDSDAFRNKIVCPKGQTVTE